MSKEKILVNIDEKAVRAADIAFWKNPKDGTQNALIRFNGKLTRLRAGMIVIKDGDKILLGGEEDEKHELSIPGGGLEPNESILKAAEREVNEEVKMKVKNVRYCQHDYCECHDELKPWVIENVPEEVRWYNYYTCLCIGEYDGEYEGKVAKVDLDPYMKKTSKFYPIDEVINAPTFKLQWKKALYDAGYIKKTQITESFDFELIKKTPTLTDLSMLWQKWQRMTDEQKRLSDAKSIELFGITNEDHYNKLVQEYAINEDLKDDAKEYFGTTYNPRLAIYINTDGTMLDGSGRRLGSDGRSRAVDHREVSDIFDRSISGDDAMYEYIAEGNIRWKPEAPGVELCKEPTTKQYLALEKAIRVLFDDDFYLDIIDERGNNLMSKEYDYINTNKIISDIRGYFDEHISLHEDTRNTLIANSRGKGQYKDQSKGKNRFERKKFSKVANAVKAYNQIDMNDFFKKDVLTVKIPVTGETNTYTVSVKMNGVCAEIQKNVKSNKNKFEFRTVIQALTKVFNTTDVYVNCTCPDYLYNFDHWNIVHNVEVNDTAHDPGPGKGIANPNDDKGRGCKHVLLVLNNGDWLMKVASVINNYTNYASEHMQKAFLKLIFPKIYGIPADEMVEQNLIDDPKFLDSSSGLIDAINAYGAKRGQYKPGTNKNPVTGTGGKQAKPAVAQPAAKPAAKPATTTTKPATQPAAAKPAVTVPAKPAPAPVAKPAATTPAITGQTK